MSTATRSARRQAKKATVTEVTPKKDELSSQQIKRMEEELVKFPNPSVYYKKKLATKFAKEFEINDRIILNWLNENGKRDFGRVKITPVPSSQSSIEIKKEIVEKSIQSTKKTSEIQCIDIESDTEDGEVLLNESNQNDSITLLEKPVIKVRPTAAATKKTPSKNELEKKLEDKNTKKETANDMKVKYDDLFKEYQEKVDIVKNLENQIPRMISEFKKYVEDMETKHKKNLQEKEEEVRKVFDDVAKKPTKSESDKTVKNLQLQLKAKESELVATKKEIVNQKEMAVNDKKTKNLEERLKKTETELDSTRKEFNEHKDNKDAMDNRYRKLIKKQEKDLDRANEDNQELLNKMKKIKDDIAKKNPPSKELIELKDLNKKLKRDLESKEKEAKKAAKEKEDVVNKHESIKKNLDKKVSKLEEDLKKKSKDQEEIRSLLSKLDEVRQTNIKDKAKYQSDLIDIQAELKNVKVDFTKKEDKFLEKNEMLREKIVQLESQNLESKNKSMSSENDVAHLKLRVSTLETEKKDISAELETKKQETTSNKTVIFECKTEIENAKTLIKSSTKDISERNSIISEQKRKIESLEKSIQDVTSELQELQKERNKISSEKVQEIVEKVKEKEYALLKLRNVVFDKDNFIKAKDAEIQKLSVRIHELKKDFDKQIENRGFEEINNQNNLRHQLLVQQQDMRKILLGEQDALRQQMAEVKVNYENILKAAIKEAENIQKNRETELQEVIHQKRALLVKVKRTLLYRPSAGHGQEKSNTFLGPKAALSYNWPLVHKNVEEKQISEIRSTEALDSLLKLTIPVARSIGDLCASRQGIKRRLEEADEVSTKRLRVSAPVLMISCCWPVALYHKKTLTMEVLVELNPMSLAPLPAPIVEQQEKKSLKRKPEDILKQVGVKKQKTVTPPLMLCYSWPVVPYQNKSVMCLEHETPALSMFPKAHSDQPLNTITKRKAETNSQVPTKKEKLESNTISYPLIVYEKKKYLHLDAMIDLRQSVVRFPEIVKKETQIELNSSSFSWPIAVYNEAKTAYTDQIIEVPSSLAADKIPPILSSKRSVERLSLPLPDAKKIKLKSPSPYLDHPLVSVPEEDFKAQEPELLTFSTIPSYKYKIVSSRLNTKCLNSPRLSGRSKVTRRSYTVPKYQKISRNGVKRSFLDFLEDLSHEEMQDVTADEITVSALDSPVIVTKPVNKKLRFSPSFLIKHETKLPERTLSRSLSEEDEFVSDHEQLLLMSSFVINSVLVKVC